MGPNHEEPTGSHSKHIVMAKKPKTMNTLKTLNKFSAKITSMIEELDTLMDNTHNEELYEALDATIRSNMESTLTQLDLTIDDISDGMYDGAEPDSEEEDWD
jgi:RNA polymerase-binding transcription factor DksA